MKKSPAGLSSYILVMWTWAKVLPQRLWSWLVVINHEDEKEQTLHTEGQVTLSQEQRDMRDAHHMSCVPEKDITLAQKVREKIRGHTGLVQYVRNTIKWAWPIVLIVTALVCVGFIDLDSDNMRQSVNNLIAIGMLLVAVAGLSPKVYRWMLFGQISRMVSGHDEVKSYAKRLLDGKDLLDFQDALKRLDKETQ